jgi:hypothetical protein
MQENIENNTKIIERLSQYINIKGDNYNKLSLGMGISNSYFSKMVKNNGSLGEDVIRKILLYYDEINPTWLLTGEEAMLKKDVAKVDTEGNSLLEAQIANEITKNSRKTFFIYQRIVDVDILLHKQLGIRGKDGYAADEAKILNDTFFKKYDFVVDSMSFVQRVNYNNQLKLAVETLSEIFFERFKILKNGLRKKLGDSEDEEK